MSRTVPRRQQPHRLTRADRAEQLLDAAGELIAERGVGAVTMEGVAAQAGVSKALPYQHFDDATTLLVRLKDRELNLLAARVSAALDGDGDLEMRVRRAVEASFTTLSERGSILPVLLLAGLPPGESDERHGPSSLGLALQASFDLRPKIAATLDRILVQGLLGAFLSWTDRLASRRTIEAVLTQTIMASAAAVSEADRARTTGRLNAPLARPSNL